MTDSEIDQPTPGPRGPRVRRGLVIGAAAAALVIIVGVALVLTSGDGTDVAGSDSGVERGPITSLEDIAGTYQRLGPGSQMYIQFFEDGTIHYSSNRDLVEEIPYAIVETRFEGTKVFLKAVKSVCGFEGDATYEIHLLESGNLQFVLIEHKSHTCSQRSDILQGQELGPVP